MINKFRTERLSILRVYGVVKGKCSCSAVGCKAPGKHPAPWAKQSVNRGVYNAKPAAECDANDFNNYNIGVACGNGIIVVDIDPRNGGHLAWHELSRGQYLPDTWIVSTGSGGTHIYYRLPEGMTIKSQSFRGIDIQSTGKYVVAPPSMHRDGIAYTWSDDSADTIGQIPPWLVKLLRSHDNAVAAASLEDNEQSGIITPPEYETKILIDILDKLPPRVGYDAWVKVGMGLHATGLKIAFSLWDQWSAKDPEQYDRDDCVRKWKSFGLRSGPIISYRYIYALADMYAINYDEHLISGWKSETPKVTQGEPDTLDGTPLTIGELDHGHILNHLFHSVLSIAQVRIDHFALSSALQILSAAAQGSYKTWSHAPLSLYQWCSARPAAGKGSYHEFTQDWIRSIHPNLLSPDFGSSAGLRMVFTAFNSRVLVKDEWHDEFISMAESRNEYNKQKLSDYKIIYNGPKALSGTVTKVDNQKQVNYPSLGIQGFGTIQGLKQAAAAGDFLSGGLASRFLFWVHPNYLENDPIAYELGDDTKIQDALKKIFEVGKCFQFAFKDSDQSIDEAQAVLMEKKSKKPVHHIPQLMATNIMTIDDDARELFHGIESEVDEVAASSAASESDETISVIKRQPLMIQKLACLRSLSDERTIVQIEDIEWARQVVGISSRGVTELLGVSSSGTRSDMERIYMVQKVLDYLRSRGGQPVTLEMILKARELKAAIMERTAHEVLLHLVAANEIQALDGHGNPVYPSKIHGKLRFVAKY